MEGPIRVPCPLRFPQPLLCAGSDALEVFEGDPALSVFRFLNETLADLMVHVFLETGLFARDLFQTAFGALGATLLQAGTMIADLLAALDRRVVRFTVGIDRDLADAEIDAEIVSWLEWFCLRHITGDLLVERAPAIDQFGATGCVAQLCALVCAALPAAFQPATFGHRDRHLIVACETPEVFVKFDGGAFVKLKCAFHAVLAARGLVCAGNRCERADQVIGGQLRISRAQVMVQQILQRELVGRPRFVRENRDRRAQMVHTGEQIGQLPFFVVGEDELDF